MRKTTTMAATRFLCILFILIGSVSFMYSNIQRNSENYKALPHLNDTDTLSKYSYHIIGWKNAGFTLSNKAKIYKTGGTVFFVRLSGQLYLVTSKHVLSGCEDSVKLKYSPDTMYVRLSSLDSTVLMVDTRVIKDTSSCLPMRISPDVIAVKINDKSAKDVYSIEHLIRPEMGQMGSSLIFGFPGIGALNQGLNFISPKSIYLKYPNYKIGQKDSLAGSKKDVLNYYLHSNVGDLNLDLHGFSGSPYFIQDLQSQQWNFAGVVIGGGENTIVVCRLENIFFPN